MNAASTKESGVNSSDIIVEAANDTVVIPPELNGSKLEMALIYLKHGFSVIPLNGRLPAIDWQEYQQRLSTKEEIQLWFSDSEYNIGIVTGRISNLVVLDIDWDGNEFSSYSDFPQTPTVRTLKGSQSYFPYPSGEEIRISVRENPLIHLRADGEFVVAPLSVVADDQQNRWVIPLKNNDLVAMPDWMLHLVVKKVEHEPEVIGDDLEVFPGIHDGERDNACAYPGQSLVPLEDHQVARLNSFNPTDAGQGEAIAYLYRNKLRYDHTRKMWLIWDSPRWRVDINGEATRCAVLTARQRLKAAITIKEREKSQALANWSFLSENVYRVRTALEMASITDELSVTPDQMDRNPWLLSCTNGVVNLKTQELQDGNQNDLISLSTNIDFVPDAKCTRWEKFLREVFVDDDLIDFVQRVVGYSLTGSTEEQYLFFCYGTGANGKSTFLNILRRIFGEYASNTQFETLQELKGDRASNDLAALCGVRLVTASEVRDGARLNEGRIKSLTGQDPITCRYLYGEYFTYQPTMKIWLAANHKPVIRGTDEAIWRRILLIPFNAYFPKDKADMKLSKDLEAEAPGILAWAVRGCSEWQKQGLRPPTVVLMATQGYRKEMDALEQFLDECTDRGPTLKVQASVLYDAYKSWADRNGEFRMSRTPFGRRMGEKGFQKITSTYVVYHGLGLKSII